MDAEMFFFFFLKERVLEVSRRGKDEIQNHLTLDEALTFTITLWLWTEMDVWGKTDDDKNEKHSLMLSTWLTDSVSLGGIRGEVRPRKHKNYTVIRFQDSE